MYLLKTVSALYQMFYATISTNFKDYMNSLETGKDCNYFSLLQTIRNANLKLKTIELDHR